MDMGIQSLIKKLSKRTAWDDAEGLNVLTGEDEVLVLDLLENYEELVKEKQDLEDSLDDEVDKYKAQIEKLTSENKKLKEKVKKQTTQKVHSNAKALQELLNTN